MIYLLFDLDGTLFDSDHIILDAFQEGIRKFNKSSHSNISVPSKEKIMSFIGIPTKNIYQTLFPQLNEDKVQIINDQCTESLSKMIYNGGGRLYDNTYSTLKNLHKKGYTFFLASNGRIKYIEAALKSTKIMKFFSQPIIHLNEKIIDKTTIVMKYKKIIPKNSLIIMIGDRESDRTAAFENNIPFIGCAYGHVGEKEILGTRWIINEFTEIPIIIKEIEKEFEKKKQLH